MFRKVLIANRGEIALRIMRTCRQMGISSVAVYSQTDARSLHVSQADEAACLEGATAAESYLDIDRIIDVALKHGCDAIHPGYGFLSENPRFAEAVTQAGIAFIGPPAAAIRLLGDKLAAKALARSLDIATVEGHPDPVTDVSMALEIASGIGYPVVLKPSLGGGGKGMRVVRNPDEMPSALSVCRKETQRAFADDGVFIEKYIQNPRHIEVQILADGFGNVVHLGERECSVQRRHQKVIEEAPSVAVSPSLREQLGSIACNLARKAGYVNAGTVEFLLDSGGCYYFLEMNTRLQVEHPVTEMITSLDLVELQLRIAAGEPLPIRQEDVRFSGWAIEARICAEDPAQDFFPATGLITRYSEPKGGNIRVDSGVGAGSLISVYFDSLLAKVIAWGRDRDEARRALVGALNGYHIEGVVTNANFVNRILNLADFCSGNVSTHLIEVNFERGQAREKPCLEDLRLAAIAATLVYHGRNAVVRESLKPMVSSIGGVARSPNHTHYVVKADGDTFNLRLERQLPEGMWSACVDGCEYGVSAPPFEFYRRRLKLDINGEIHRFILNWRGTFIESSFNGVRRTFEIYTRREWDLTRYVPAPVCRVAENLLRSPMPGLVVEVKVITGDRVHRGQDLVVLESMKMETNIPSPRDGIVSEVMINQGQTVETGEVLVTFSTLR